MTDPKVFAEKVHNLWQQNKFDEAALAVAELMQTSLSNSFENFSKDVHIWARSKGWWDDREIAIKAMMSAGLTRERATTMVANEILALVHTEVSEMVEALRHGNPTDDKVPIPGLSAEGADTIIRIADLNYWLGAQIGPALVTKHNYNWTRSHKHGGKVC